MTYIFLALFFSVGLMASCATQGKYVLNPDVDSQEQLITDENYREVQKPELSSEEWDVTSHQEALEIYVNEIRIADDRIVCMGNAITIWLDDTPPTEQKIIVDGVEYADPVEEDFVIFVDGLQVPYTDNHDGTLTFTIE